MRRSAHSCASPGNELKFIDAFTTMAPRVHPKSSKHPQAQWLVWAWEGIEVLDTSYTLFKDRISENRLPPKRCIRLLRQYDTTISQVAQLLQRILEMLQMSSNAGACYPQCASGPAKFGKIMEWDLRNLSKRDNTTRECWDLQWSSLEAHMESACTCASRFEHYKFNLLKKIPPICLRQGVADSQRVLNRKPCHCPKNGYRDRRRLCKFVLIPVDEVLPKGYVKLVAHTHDSTQAHMVWRWSFL